ncbi:hypothetical protein EVAR_14952_1 [Eumeta japonica]|uniref:Uncharacterized protein n=1 Tax=Eumeta variegata TaxID=151549 RepID=A0A4C1XLH9_EUMVA|nr:hypothetical protein EVAR_14952_1 [Eumeta japonica]
MLIPIGVKIKEFFLDSCEAARNSWCTLKPRQIVYGHKKKDRVSRTSGGQTDGRTDRQKRKLRILLFVKAHELLARSPRWTSGYVCKFPELVGPQASAAGRHIGS